MRSDRRISIYIPADLARLMDQHPRMNWSGLAQVAFRQAIERQEKTIAEKRRLEAALVAEYGPRTEETP